MTHSAREIYLAESRRFGDEPVNEATKSKSWYSPTELAGYCACSVERIEELSRRQHWPRVHGEHGGKIGVDIETVQRALGGTAATVHGSIPAR